MSQAVSTYQMLDDRLAISDTVNFGVSVGGQSINQQVFASQTATATSVNVNALIPSLQVIVDRRIMLRTSFNITLQGKVHTVGNYLVRYPQNTVLSAFMFSQMVNNLSCQVNNTTLASNYQDTLDTILRQMTPEELYKYSDTTPIQLDYYQSPITGTGGEPADPVVNNNVGLLSPFINISQATNYQVKPRGAWVIDAIYNNSSATAVDQVKTVTITVSTCEPIFCSPFLYGDVFDEQNCGMSGISNINFNFNMGNVGKAITWFPLENSGDPTTSDVLTNVFLGGTNGASQPLPAFNRFEILMTFISPKPSTIIPLTCALPYYQLNAYKTSVVPPASATADFAITSSIVAPNCIPDKVYLAVRPQALSPVLQAQANDYRFPIKNVSITWNTLSGVLSTATQQDLYFFSKKAGLRQDYLSWSGVGAGYPTNPSAIGNIPLTGGMVCLDFNENIPIQEAYYSSSSLGQWTFSVNVLCSNQTGDVPPPVELLVIFFQSGIFQSTSGSSSQYIGVLSKDEVLKVAQEDSMSITEHRRMVGGSVRSWLASAIKASSPKIKSYLVDKVKQKFPVIASHLGLGHSGGAVSGGAVSGGAVSGGRRHPRTRE